MVFVFASLLHVSTASAGVGLQLFAVISTAPGLASGLFSMIGPPTLPHAGVTSRAVTIDVAALSKLPPTLL